MFLCVDYNTDILIIDTMNNMVWKEIEYVITVNTFRAKTLHAQSARICVLLTILCFRVPCYLYYVYMCSLYSITFLFVLLTILCVCPC